MRFTGRFLSADRYITEQANTQNYDRYSYVSNNPLSLIDPSGFEGEYLKEFLITGSKSRRPEDPWQYGWSTDEGGSYQSNPNGRGMSNAAVAQYISSTYERLPQGEKPTVCRSVPTSNAERAAIARGDTDSYYKSRAARGDAYAADALNISHGRGVLGVGALLWYSIVTSPTNVPYSTTPNKFQQYLFSGQLSRDLATAHMVATDADNTGVPNMLSANDIRQYHEDVFQSAGLPRSTFGGDWPSRSSTYWYGGCETTP